MTTELFWALLGWLVLNGILALSAMAGWIKPLPGTKPWLPVVLCPILVAWMLVSRWS